MGFTLPAQLRPLAWRYKKIVYNLLFAAAAATVLDLCRNPEHLGAEAGVTLVLHTWNRKLTYHPHGHGIVLGGGLDPAADRWVAFAPTFFIHLKVISCVFRGKFLATLKAAYARGAFAADTQLDRPRFQKLLALLYNLHWNVFAKPPFAGPPAIVNYLGRYTHRTGISNSRLVAVTDQSVTFRTKDGNTCTLPPHEFIRRFLLHVLPEHFVKIRHYGLLAPGNVNTKLLRARELLEQDHPPPPPDTTTTAATEAQDNSTPDDLAKAQLRCPTCQGTTFSLIATLLPERRRRNQPPPHT